MLLPSSWKQSLCLGKNRANSSKRHKMMPKLCACVLLWVFVCSFFKFAYQYSFMAWHRSKASPKQVKKSTGMGKHC